MPMTTAAAAAAADTLEKPPRKFPLPCWTQEETLALVDAYRERWYALRRGYLRTADWDAVAAAVASRCPDASPAKTSAQCRHKMEKLRQRYRAEKQRSLSFPTGRFFSSWFFFDKMDAMDNGTSLSAVRSNEEPDNRENPSNGFRLKTFLDQKVLKLKLNPESITNLEGDICPKFTSDNGDGVKSSPKIVDGRVSSNIGSKVLNGYPPFLGMGSDKDADETNFGGEYHVKNHLAGITVPTGFKEKNFGKVFGDLKGGFESEHFGGKGFDASDGFRTKSLDNENLLPPRFRAKKFGNIDGRVKRGVNYGEENNTCDANVGFWVRVASDRNSVPSGLKGKYGGNLKSDIDSRGVHGFSNACRFGVEKRNGGGGVKKRERNPIEEMVLSIKMLAEDFVKMEKMKMEIAMEIEENRMHMEMKRNELLLESQRQIVDAFVKSLSAVKNKKIKMAAASSK